MSILWNFDKYAEIEELPFDPSGIDDIYWISDVERLIPAGLPLKRTSGVVAPLGKNDTPTCFAAEDYHIILTNAQQPKLIPCVTKGYIEKAKVLEAMGVEQDPTADWAESLAALGLYLVDELGNLPGGGSSGGGGSGGLLVVEIAIGPGSMVMDKTWQEIADSDFAVCFVANPNGRTQAYITAVGENTVDVVTWGKDGPFAKRTFRAQNADSYPRLVQLTYQEDNLQ